MRPGCARSRTRHGPSFGVRRITTQESVEALPRRLTVEGDRIHRAWGGDATEEQFRFVVGRPMRFFAEGVGGFEARGILPAPCARFLVVGAGDRCGYVVRAPFVSSVRVKWVLSR